MGWRRPLPTSPPHSTGHSDCIVTARNEETAQQFLAQVDSAAVYWNASTRFTDGGEFGLGLRDGDLHPEAPRPRAPWA